MLSPSYPDKLTTTRILELVFVKDHWLYTNLICLNYKSLSFVYVVYINHSHMVLLYTFHTWPPPSTHDMSLAHGVLASTSYPACPYHITHIMRCIWPCSTHSDAPLLSVTQVLSFVFLPIQVEPFPIEMLPNFLKTVGQCGHVILVLFFRFVVVS